MSEFKFYSGDEFLSVDVKQREWLIEGFVKELDSIIVVGTPKAGKSVLMFQLICSLTSGHPFLDKFEVKRPCNVTYLQLEGEFSDSQDRMKRMIQTQEFDSSKFFLGYLEPQNLDSTSAMAKLMEDIHQFQTPDVIIIDPAYFAFKGSMSDDNIVRNFLGNLRILKNFFGCTIILVHHTHKLKRDEKGKIINEGDQAMFGSQFFSAWPDHILFLTVDESTKNRTLSCNTQRSGKIESLTHMKMVQPEPLYFKPIEDLGTGADLFKAMSERQEMLSATAWSQILGITRQTFYRNLKPLFEKDFVTKSFKERPILYGIKNAVV